MKKLLYLTIVGVMFMSCKNKDVEPTYAATFKLTSFDREFVNGKFYCKATIEIKGLIEDYSIDGLLYTEDITKIFWNLPYNESLKDNIYPEGEGKFYFNLYGKHKGDITIQIEWTSVDDRNNYLIGWHLSYGFSADCTLLMKSLDTSILNK